MEDFFQAYFEYAGVTESEPPASFHRWSAVSMIGALLGRNCYIPFGHSRIYPNQYVMIMGSPGTRKSSAINIATNLLKTTGFNQFSSSKTSKERFLMDMVSVPESDDLEDLLDLTLDEPAASYIAIGEFTDFIGQNNMEFVTMLTNLWDCPDNYTNPKIHGKSVDVNKPVVNILGGNTAQGFTLAFPPEALGNGFLSRLIFVHGESTGRKVTFPKAPEEELKDRLVERLAEIKRTIRGKFDISPEATKLFDRIYNNAVEIDDNRFKHYNTRRLTHLIKLTMIIAASDLRMIILPSDVLKANTLLYYTEKKMPKALGEFGKSRYSDISNTILDLLDHSKVPLTSNEIFKKVSQDIGKMAELIEVIKNLEHADKIQLTTSRTKTGYMSKKTQLAEWSADLIIEDWLIEEEKI